MKIGVDYIGVGVGALIFNPQGKFLMMLRGPKSRNERGKWEIPGGKVEWGETFEAAVKREIQEETGLEIRVKGLLGIADHIIFEENQHWVSPTYICEVVSGEAVILEPEKCVDIGWFSIEEAEKMPLSLVTKSDIEILKKQNEKNTTR